MHVLILCHLMPQMHLIVRSRRLLADLSLTAIQCGDGGATAGRGTAVALKDRRQQQTRGCRGRGSRASPGWMPHPEWCPHPSREPRPPLQVHKSWLIGNILSEINFELCSNNLALL